eukprot:54250-Chlamydomonas_euryale.AAC.2
MQALSVPPNLTPSSLRARLRHAPLSCVPFAHVFVFAEQTGGGPMAEAARKPSAALGRHADRPV